MNPTPDQATTAIPALLAHQGGWDEILMILGPLLVVGIALWVANKRANQLDQGDGVGDQGDEHIDAAAGGGRRRPDGDR